MSQERLDEVKVYSFPRESTRKCMPKVMEPEILDPSFFKAFPKVLPKWVPVILVSLPEGKTKLWRGCLTPALLFGSSSAVGVRGIV